MAVRDSSGMTPIFIFGALLLAGVVAGMIYIPPYAANREVEAAVKRALAEVQPVDPDEKVLSAINGWLFKVQTTRYWVEADGQHHDLGLQLTHDDVTITRDGNRQVSVDVHYTQSMYVPILRKTLVLPFAFHVDGPRP